MERKPHFPNDPTRFTTGMRLLLMGLGRLVLPSEIHNDYRGFEDAERLLKEGKGLIVRINHFSERDPATIFIDLFGRSAVMRNRVIVGPVAEHQYHRPITQLTARLADFGLFPLVTSDTLQHEGYQGETMGEGIFDYLGNGVQAVKDGGILLVAPQGGRRGCLINDQIDFQVMRGLMLEVMRKKVKNFGLICVGLGLEGVKDYGVPGMEKIHLLEKGIVRYGQLYTYDKLMELAGNNNRNLLDMIDYLVFSDLMNLVPSKYIPEDILVT